MTKPTILIPGDVDQQRGYRITKWHALDNFECLECQYSTVWLDKMEKHLEEGNHPWAYPTPEVPEDLQPVDLKPKPPTY